MSLLLLPDELLLVVLRDTNMKTVIRCSSVNVRLYRLLSNETETIARHLSARLLQKGVNAYNGKLREFDRKHASSSGMHRFLVHRREQEYERLDEFLSYIQENVYISHKKLMRMTPRDISGPVINSRYIDVLHALKKCYTHKGLLKCRDDVWRAIFTTDARGLFRHLGEEIKAFYDESEPAECLTEDSEWNSDDSECSDSEKSGCSVRAGDWNFNIHILMRRVEVDQEQARTA